MEPNLRQPTKSDHYQRLLEIANDILGGCELQPDDVPDGVDPFDVVEGLRRVATEEGDHLAVGRLSAAMAFGEALQESLGAKSVETLGEIVERCEGHLRQVQAPLLEVAHG